MRAVRERFADIEKFNARMDECQREYIAGRLARLDFYMEDGNYVIEVEL